jgi:hypothetical protein
MVLAAAAPRRGVRLFLGGKEVRADHVVRLPAGRYPLLLRVALRGGQPVPPGERLDASFRKVPPPDEQYAADLAAVRNGADVLQRIVRLAPGSEPAARAAALLKAAR